MNMRKVGLIAVGGAIAVVLIVVLVAVLLRPSPTATTPTPAPTQPPVSASPSWNPSAGDAGDSEDLEHGPAEVQEANWGPVVDRFSRNFTRVDGGTKKWRQRLIGRASAPDVTPAVAKQLATVDVRRVPKGRYEHREILQSSAYNLAVGIQYSEGWGMVLYLQTDGVDWQIYAYDRWEQ